MKVAEASRRIADQKEALKQNIHPISLKLQARQQHYLKVKLRVREQHCLKAIVKVDLRAGILEFLLVPSMLVYRVGMVNKAIGQTWKADLRLGCIVALNNIVKV